MLEDGIALPVLQIGLIPLHHTIEKRAYGMNHPIEGHRLKCPVCESFFIICSSFFRGHRHCSSACSLISRKRSVNGSGSRYQNSFEGRKKHAQRQMKYRLKQASKNKVTHHSSVRPQDRLKIRVGNIFAAKNQIKAVNSHVLNAGCR